jgi:hypothetical protein
MPHEVHACLNYVVSLLGEFSCRKEHVTEKPTLDEMLNEWLGVSAALMDEFAKPISPPDEIANSDRYRKIRLVSERIDEIKKAAAAVIVAGYPEPPPPAVVRPRRGGRGRRP